MVKGVAGRAIRVNDRYYSGLRLLNALVHCPYEANMHALLSLLPMHEEQLFVNAASSDVYNEWCRMQGIKSCPQLRKAFEANPYSLRHYCDLWHSGFRDVNLMVPALKKIEESHLEFDDGVRLFVEDSLPRRGERATLHALFRDPTLTPEERRDASRMFRAYRAHLTPEELQTILKGGFTRYNHDLLAIIGPRLKYANLVFGYCQKQRALEDEVLVKLKTHDGKAGGEAMLVYSYKFRLPVDSNELERIGGALHNCVASYRGQVANGASTIVYALRDEEYRLCIEVQGGQVVQALANYNAAPQGPDLKALEGWVARHRLEVTNRW